MRTSKNRPQRPGFIEKLPNYIITYCFQSTNMSDDTKEIMSQEEINAYIASVTANEEKELQKQAAGPEKNESGALSQNDIDALFKQQPEEKASLGVRQNSGAVSQSEIDEMVTQELQEPLPHTEQSDSGVISQSDFDERIDQQQKEIQGAQAQDRRQDGTDTTLIQDQSELSQGKGDVWEDLGGNILSQDEINALLSGLNEPAGAPARLIDTVSESREKGGPDPVKDTPLISTKSSIERQKEKEEKIIQKKIRASAMIRELLKMEKARIANLQTRKDKMVNEDLYARYEITRSDRSKITVSMSEKTAEQYHSSHPDYTMYKI